MVETTIAEVLGPQANASLLAQMILATLDGLAVQSLLSGEAIPTNEICEFLITRGDC
jgi:hypothetical protein